MSDEVTKEEGEEIHFPSIKEIKPENLDVRLWLGHFLCEMLSYGIAVFTAGHDGKIRWVDPGRAYIDTEADPLPPGVKLRYIRKIQPTPPRRVAWKDGSLWEVEPISEDS